MARSPKVADKRTKSRTQFMVGAVPDIPGQKAPAYDARKYQQEIMRLLKRSSHGFPGAQPVSFARKHLENDLKNEDFFVCEKSDGLRCLMYLGLFNQAEAVFLVTRNNEFYYIPGYHVPLSESDLSSFTRKGTLIDGELVRKHDGELQFLMFDLLAFDGELLTSRNLNKRLGYLQQNVYKPFRKLCATFPDDTALLPFKILMKPMEFAYGIDRALKAVRGHTSDGLIFTSRDAPYVFGTDRKILKWKPADENSVDFQLRLGFKLFTDPETREQWYDYDSIPECSLYAWCGGDKDKEFGKIYLTETEWDKLKELSEPLDHRIVECYMDDKERWRFLRFRDDKLHGNHIDTVESVIESIRDRVTEEELLEASKVIRENWHMRTPPPRKRQVPDDEEKANKKQHINGD